jgi:hypothetical protein
VAQDAIRAYLESLRKDGEAIPPDTILTTELASIPLACVRLPNLIAAEPVDVTGASGE